MTISYSGTAGASGATIYITGSETLATLKTSLASNTSWATVNGSTITFNASLSIGNGTTTGNFTAADCVLDFPQAYTFTVPNNSAQSGSATTLSDTAIIFDGSAKSYSNAINYGTHTWTRVVYRSQITTPRNDLFQNTGCIFVFNNVQLAVSSTATSYPYDFIHVYSNTTGTLQGLTITGLGGAGSANSVEIGSATGTTTTLQGLTIGGNFGAITLNNGGTSYGGTQDFRALSWPLNTTWTFNYGSGGGTAYITNPNKPSGWTGYAFLAGGAGGSGNIIERYTHDITAVNSSATGIVGVNSGDFRSGAFVWAATSSTGGVTPTQYVTTATLTGAYPGTLTNYSTSVTTAAWLYGYNTFVGGRTYTPTGVGITDTILMVADVTTLSQSAVGALTSLATLDNLYDASRYWNTLNSTNIQIPALGTNIITYSGSQLNLGTYNLIINSGTTTAGNAFSVSGSTITIYASNLATGTKFTSFTTTGTVTVNSGVTVTVPYAGSGGTQGVLTLNNLQTLSTIYVATSQGGTQLAYTALTGSNTSYTLYIPPNSATSYYYKVVKYGYQPSTGTFNPTAVTAVTVAQAVDTSITQSTVATVAAYTALANPDQIYDYAAYYETTNAGIVFTRLNLAAGKNLSFGSSILALNTAASSVYSISGTTATIKTAATVTTGATFTSFGTTGSLTNSGSTIQCVYTTSVGTSTVVTITNLPYTSANGGSYVSLLNNSNAQVQYVGPIISGSTVLYIAPGGALSYSVKIACYTFNSATSGFTTQGYVSVTASLGTDTGITQGTVATVAGYGSFSSPDQIYDYLAYWETTNNTGGITVTRPATKNGTQVSFGNNNVTLNATAANAYVYTAGTPNALAVKVTTLAAGVSYLTFATSGTVTLSNGATITCVYTSNVGTSSVLVLTGVVAGSAVYIQNASAAQQSFVTGQSGTYSYPLPPGASAGTWKWATKALGYTGVVGSYAPSGGGTFTAAATGTQKINPDGSVAYQGSTSSLVSTSFTGLTEADIIIGNGAISVQNAFDASETALVTAAGLAWLAGGLGELTEYNSFDGNFLFMTHNWRLKALNTSSGNATLYGFPISADGNPINTTNGNIIIASNTTAQQLVAALLAASTSTYNTVGTVGQSFNYINNTAPLIPALV
jgi:hypothetical protein